jgi:hypothetical protein
MTRRIELTQGYHALLDDEDFARVAAYSWHVAKRRGRRYAVANVGRGAAKTTVYLHRLVLDAPPGVEVDHRDGEGLNNTRANLRACTHTENMCNAQPRRGGSSRYKGVFWCATRGRWLARVKLSGRTRQVGTFTSERAAALAYNAAARALHGEFARLNDIPAEGGDAPCPQ